MVPANEAGWLEAATEAKRALRGCSSVSRCASCKAEILWAWSGNTFRLTPAGPTGNVELTPEGDELIAKVWGTAHVWPEGEARYRSHFATCPHADRFRRR